MSRRFNPFSGTSRTISEDRQLTPRNYDQRNMISKIFRPPRKKDKQVVIVLDKLD